MRHYYGDTRAAGGGGGNRAGYFAALESTANAARHSVLTGEAPGGAVLRLQKTFRTKTYRGRESFIDHLETPLDVPQSGNFTWHINQSTRPIVAQERGRPAEGDPSPTQEFSGSPSGPPADGAQPCVEYPSSDPECYNEHPFTVPEGPGIDNARAVVLIRWQTAANDWDMQIFRDSDGDGSSVGEQELASSAQGGTNFERAEFAEPVLKPGEDYVVKVTNYEAIEPYDGTITFRGPESFQPAGTETWRLTCERGGEILSSQQVFIERGDRKQLDLTSGCRRGGDGPGPGPGLGPGPGPGPGAGDTGCRGRDATISGSRGDDTIRGTDGVDVINGLRGDDVITALGGNDYVCGRLGNDRIGGGAGDDFLFGERNHDRIQGDNGNDVLRGGAGFDRVDGGPGNDDEKD